MVWLNTIRLRSNSPEVRRKALECLAPPGTRDALTELLIAGLDDEDARVRCAAVGGLTRSRTTNPWPPVLTALQDSDSVVREAAAAGLGRLGDPASSHRLVSLLKDATPGVRTAAAVALRNLGWRPATGKSKPSSISPWAISTPPLSQATPR